MNDIFGDVLRLSLFSWLIFADNRREKSLALLTQNFVKLFVCSTVSKIVDCYLLIL